MGSRRPLPLLPSQLVPQASVGRPSVGTQLIAALTPTQHQMDVFFNPDRAMPGDKPFVAPPTLNDLGLGAVVPKTMEFQPAGPDTALVTAPIGVVPPPPTGKTAETSKNTRQQRAFKGPVGSGDIIGALQQAIQQEKMARMRQAGSYQDYANLLASADTETMTDLSPLAALVDEWTGSNFAQSYRRPENPQNMAQGAAAAQQAGQMMAESAGQETQNQLALAKYQQQMDYQNRQLELQEEANRIRWAALGAKDKGSTKEAAELRRMVLTTKEGQKMRSMIELRKSLNRYRDIVNKEGVRFTGSARAAIESAYSDFKMKYKEAANLGALTGPDIAVLEESIKPATGFSGWTGEILTEGKKGILAGLAKAENAMISDAGTTMSVLDSAFPEKEFQSVLGNYRNQFGPMTTQKEPEYSPLKIFEELKKRNIRL